MSALPPDTVADAAAAEAPPQRVGFHDFLSPTEELLDEARSGRMFVLVDDEDRENEGDLIIAADAVTPAQMAFMVRHTSGLVCVALPGAVLDAVTPRA